MTAPRFQALLDDLLRLNAAQTPAPLGLAGASRAASAAVPAQTDVRWGVGLPADFQRAGAEIYRSMRTEGSTSVRDWLNQRYQASRTSPVWTDL